MLTMRNLPQFVLAVLPLARISVRCACIFAFFSRFVSKAIFDVSSGKCRNEDDKFHEIRQLWIQFTRQVAAIMEGA
jgi:hypothetical protein